MLVYFRVFNVRFVVQYCCCCCCCCQVASVVSDSVRPQRRQPTRLPRPWDSPGKNTGVGCHFLLQCMKVKSNSEVTQSCPTLHDPMDCSLPGSSTHGISQARVLEWGAIAFSISTATCCYLVIKSCPTLLQPCGVYNPPGSSVHGIFQAGTLEWVAISFSRESSWPRDQTRVSSILWIESSFIWI